MNELLIIAGYEKEIQQEFLNKFEQFELNNFGKFNHENYDNIETWNNLNDDKDLCLGDMKKLLRKSQKQFWNSLLSDRNIIWKTNLTGRFLLKYIQNAKEAGYTIKLFYIFKDSKSYPSNILETRSKENFWSLYQNNTVDEWALFHKCKGSYNEIATGWFQACSKWEPEKITLFLNNTRWA